MSAVPFLLSLCNDDNIKIIDFSKYSSYDDSFDYHTRICGFGNFLVTTDTQSPDQTNTFCVNKYCQKTKNISGKVLDLINDKKNWLPDSD